MAIDRMSGEIEEGGLFVKAGVEPSRHTYSFFPLSFRIFYLFVELLISFSRYSAPQKSMFGLDKLAEQKRQENLAKAERIKQSNVFLPSSVQIVSFSLIFFT